MTDLTFFEPTSVMTAGGAAFAIQLVTNTLGYWGVPQRWTALVLAVVIAALNTDWELQIVLALLMMIVNACLLFCTALGLSVSMGRAGSGGALGFRGERDNGWTRFFGPWF